MDSVHFIKEVLSEPDLKIFLLMFDPSHQTSLGLMLHDLTTFHRFMSKTNFLVQPDDEKLDLIVGLRLTASKVGNFMREIGNFMSEIPDASKNLSTISSSHDLANTLDPIQNEKVKDLVKKFRETLDLINSVMVSGNYLKQTEPVRKFKEKVIRTIVNYDIIKHSFFLLEKEDSRIKPWNKEDSEGLLLIKAVPSLTEIILRDSSDYKKMSDFLLELFAELEDLPKEISKACEKQPLPLVLVGSLLSHKERIYHTWNKVKEDLCKIKDSDDLATNLCKDKESDYLANNNHMWFPHQSLPNLKNKDNHLWHIIAYCYGDLPYFLKPCFLYLACYPIDYKIPAWSLTAIWVAEGFIIPEKGEDLLETAHKYLEQLVKRSLVLVSKRSFLGRIKHCRVPPSIHEFAIQQSCNDGFLVPNPNKEKMEYLFRFAIHHDDKNQYTEVQNNYIQAFLAFDFHRNVLGSPLFLRVLELRNSAIPNNLENMIYLRYLGLRDTTIETLPENIGNMRNLQTLDVRDTTIKTLPESLWNIPALCNVYVSPGPEIKGPPPAAIPNLQTLKTVVVPKSWLEYNLDFPWQENNRHFLINLRKIAILIVNNLWKHISNLLNHLVNLHSIKFLNNGDFNIPSEYVDARAFRVLETVKSFKCEGKLNFRKLPIDNIKFPPNLLKLTLTKTGFKKDPMPFLEKLQSLKYLSLQDGAYTGEKMICSTNGFPQLRFIELSKLENLKIWEVKPMAMAQLTTMRVVQCYRLDDLPDLEDVTEIITDIFDY